MNTKNYISFSILLCFLLLIPSAKASAFIAVDQNNQTGIADGTVTAPYATIMAAINAAPSGSSIRVAAGTYNETIVIRDKTLSLTGGYTGGTNYAGGGPGDFTSSTDNPSQITGQSYQPVVLFIGNSDNSTIEGFTLSSGSHGIMLDTDETWPYLTGITITGNIIENNDPADDSWGGGIRAEGTNIIISNNIIRNNRAGRGGGLACLGNNFTVTGNQISNNSATSDHGGGIIAAGTGRITNNLIQGNNVGIDIGYGWGGGIHIFGPSAEPVIFSGNTVQNNHASSSGGGVFVDDGASATLQNNLIINNTVAEYGGAGIYVDAAGEGEAGDARSTALIINCTVAKNSGGYLGGNGIFIETSDVIVLNSIFWNNGGDNFWTNAESSLNITYTLSEEPFAGTGNISQDPLFVNSSSDFHLQSRAGHWDLVSSQWVTDQNTSPAIDAGNPQSNYSAEPAGNGSRINLGRYGNTSEASKSKTAGTVPNNGTMVTSDLWIRGVIDSVEKGKIEAVWQKGGEDTTSRGDRVIWGHFYASPNDVTWGSENNPDLFVKIWLDVSGRIDLNYFHVSVPDIEVSSDYPYDGTADEHGTTTMSRRYIRQYYENGQSYSDENYEDGNPPSGYSPAGNSSGYSTINNLRIGSMINTVEKGLIDGIWRLGGQDNTARGDQVVWGLFYASPSDVTWGSSNNPDLFVKIWFDVGGRVDVNFFHVSVPDIEVYSDLPSDGSYDQKGTTIMDNRYIRHEYWR
jgi:parallel beta-helix repeat protein